MYRRNGDRVTLEMSFEEYLTTVGAFGLATGFLTKRGDLENAEYLTTVLNSINEGNPKWTPAAVPEEFGRKAKQ